MTAEERARVIHLNPLVVQNRRTKALTTTFVLGLALMAGGFLLVEEVQDWMTPTLEWLHDTFFPPAEPGSAEPPVSRAHEDSPSMFDRATHDPPASVEPLAHPPEASPSPPAPAVVPSREAALGQTNVLQPLSSSPLLGVQPVAMPRTTPTLAEAAGETFPAGIRLSGEADPAIAAGAAVQAPASVLSGSASASGHAEALVPGLDTQTPPRSAGSALIDPQGGGNVIGGHVTVDDTSASTEENAEAISAPPGVAPVGPAATQPDLNPSLGTNPEESLPNAPTASDPAADLDNPAKVLDVEASDVSPGADASVTSPDEDAPPTGAELRTETPEAGPVPATDSDANVGSDGETGETHLDARVNVGDAGLKGDVDVGEAPQPDAGADVSLTTPEMGTLPDTSAGGTVTATPTEGNADASIQVEAGDASVGADVTTPDEGASDVEAGLEAETPEAGILPAARVSADAGATPAQGESALAAQTEVGETSLAGDVATTGPAGEPELTADVEADAPLAEPVSASLDAEARLEPTTAESDVGLQTEAGDAPAALDASTSDSLGDSPAADAAVEAGAPSTGSAPEGSVSADLDVAPAEGTTAAGADADASAPVTGSDADASLEADGTIEGASGSVDTDGETGPSVDASAGLDASDGGGAPLDASLAGGVDAGGEDAGGETPATDAGGEFSAGGDLAGGDLDTGL